MRAKFEAGLINREFTVWIIWMLILFAATSLWFLNAQAMGSHSVLSSFPADDAFIHLTYARSLVEQHCPCFNKGVSEAGMTSPLWVILLAAMLGLGKVFGFGSFAAAKILSAGFGLFSALFAGLLFQDKRAKSSDLLLLAVVSGMVLLDPHFNFSRLAGMEVTLAAFLVLASFYFYIEERPLLLGLALGLSALARPENFLLIALLSAAWLWRIIRGKQKPASLLPVVLPIALLVGAWFLYDFKISGRPLPNTYYAKSIPFAFFRPGTFGRLISDGVFELAGFRMGFGVLFYFAGAAFIALRRRSLWPVLVYPWLFLYGLSVTRDFFFVGGYYFDRYFHPVIPCLVIPIGIGIVACYRYLDSAYRGGRKILSLAALAVVILLTSGLALAWFSALREQRSMLALDCLMIRKLYAAQGKWIDKYLPQEAVIATFDVGAVSFYANRKIVDLNGLNTHQMLEDPSYPLKLKPSYYLLDVDQSEAKILRKDVWRLRRVGQLFYIYLRPLYATSAYKYARTERTPLVEVLFEASYTNPGQE